MSMNLYLASAFAHRMVSKPGLVNQILRRAEVEFAIFGFVCVAESETEAKARGLAHVYDTCPTTNGWKGHDVDALAAPDDQIEQVYKGVSHDIS